MGSIFMLIALVYYVCAVMAVNLYGKEFPELFGTLGTSMFTLFTIMTLEGWVEGVVNPIMQKHPYACLLHSVHHLYHVHGAEPIHRRHRRRHAGGARQGRGLRAAGRTGTDAARRARPDP